MVTFTSPLHLPRAHVMSYYTSSSPIMPCNLCAHRPHGITGTFRERDWNISVCIYTRIVYCDWTVEFQLKGSRRMMSDYLFSSFKTFFDDPNKPVFLWNSQCMTDSSFCAVFVLRFDGSLIYKRLQLASHKNNPEKCVISRLAYLFSNSAWI